MKYLEAIQNHRSGLAAQGEPTGISRSWLSLISTSFTEDGSLDVDTLNGHFSNINVGTFMNMREVKSENTSYLILRYEVSESQLDLFSLDSTLVAAAIENGQLKGRAKDVHVTSDAHDVIAFIEQADDSLFTNRMLFSRVTEKMCNDIAR